MINKKISMIVWNEFLTDARVLKEAETLVQNGYTVTVHAIHTPEKTKAKEVLENGVKVVRVSRNVFWGLRKRIGLKSNKAVSTSVNAKQSSENTANSSKHDQAKGSRLTKILKPVARLFTYTGLFYALVKSKPDIIHAHDVNTLIIAWLASIISRSHLVYDAHEVSTSREGYQKIRNLVGWTEKKLMPKANATITTTEMRAKFFARAYSIDRPIVLQNRPALYELKPSNRIREELALAEDWPIIVYQGGVQSGRGLERLIQAASKVRNCYFVLVGSGRLVDSLKELSVELEVTKQVKFIPVVPLAELPEYTASADIGIQPIINTCFNHYSTDSNKLFEYALAGLPVIATNFPEIRKIVEKFQIGELADESLEGLVVAINKLLSGKELREYYALNSSKSREALSWQSQEKTLIQLYDKLNKI